MSFSLSLYPWVYCASYKEDGSWTETYTEKPHKTPQEEALMSPQDYQALLMKRNSFPELPLVNYTTQYGMGCFEGLKAFPQKDGSLKLFRPGRNATRMHNSMKGLMMPGYPENLFVEAARSVIRKNQDLGFRPQYNSSWEKDHFVEGSSIYLRPFTYSEPAIGLGISKAPWVIMIATPVSSYFTSRSSKAITTNKVRATPHGSGWIKCDANYVVPTLAKKEAEAQGYMEAIFLDSLEGKYLEEGSSCNLFVLMKDGTLTTPVLGDTILPGITRESILTLAKDMGIPTSERRITIDEALDQGQEVFVTGTAAGVSFLESITHKGRTAVFNQGKMGPVTTELLRTLKGIQFGALPDKYGWMTSV